jgi:hypothetical protein
MILRKIALDMRHMLRFPLQPLLCSFSAVVIIERDTAGMKSCKISLNAKFNLQTGVYRQIVIALSHFMRVVGWGTKLQVGRSRVRVLMKSLDFYNVSNRPNRIMALGSIQPLTEMSTRKCFWGLWSSWCVGLTTMWDP